MPNSVSFFRTHCVALVMTLGLTGCAAPTVGGHTISETLASISAAIMSGDFTVSALSGRDCRTLSTLIRNGASYCDKSSTTTAAITEPALIQVAGIETDPDLLGFAPVDRRAAADFSLEIARQQNAGIDAPMLAFGMISASNLPSYSYNVKMRDGTDPKAKKVAMLSSTTQTLRTSH
ncbi:MAG: hypothetical protein Q7T44_17260 [Parvibaculum sp.]|nr:hypothetical protein [Parvibaculum sp.]